MWADQAVKPQVAIGAADALSVTMKLMALRYDGTCVRCDAPLAAKSKGWYDSVAKKVTCCDCQQPGTAQPLAPPQPIDTGTAGAAAQQEYERRRAKHDAQIEDKWGEGRLGRFVKRVAAEPQSTSAYSKGADGERTVGGRIDDALAGNGFVLHDRKVPGTKGNIDHIAIASSGTWIIDAKKYTGLVEERDKGGWAKTDLRLYVNNRDQTKLVRSMGWQTEAVRKQLDPMGFADLPIHRAVCFTNAQWPRFTKPFVIDGVWVIWPSALAEKVAAPGPVPADAVNAIAHRLSEQLRANPAPTAV